ARCLQKFDRDAADVSRAARNQNRHSEPSKAEFTQPRWQLAAYYFTTQLREAERRINTRTP
ncbi:MAG: hypothetical protein WA713_12180, partial [Candidatus Acidiferrales bacterium]